MKFLISPLFFILLLLMPTYVLKAQNQDCNTSKLVCGNQNFSDNSSGTGRDDFQSSANNQGCLSSGERQSAWYEISIQTSGTLIFTINPNSPTDYDFAVYGPNVACNALGSPIRCSYAAGTGTTGLSFGATATSENAGGSGFVRYLDVVAGQTYYVIIDNFSVNNQGFALNWGGTASLSAIKADFTFDLSCNSVNFNNSANTCEGNLVYNWNFGDGSPITEENSLRNPRHVYSQTGTYTVTLTVTINSNGANNGQTSSIQKNVVINQVPPLPSITNLADSYCLNASPFNPTGSPAGGTFRIFSATNTQGTDITQLNPATLGAGEYTLRYRYVSSSNSNCVGLAFKTFIIKPLPALNFVNLNTSYCQSEPAFNLQASPTGGTFTVDGVVSTQFIAANLSNGTHSVAYTYTDPASNCQNTITQEVFINALPQITFTNLRDLYCISGNSFSLQAIPVGGTFRVNGTPSTQFSPSALGIGTHEITYQFTDANTGCSRTQSRSVEVVTAPQVAILNIPTQFCKNDAPITLQGTPAGGIFSIDGIVSNQVNPAQLSNGIHTINYTYTDPDDASCNNSISQTFRVFATPAVSLLNVQDSYCINDNLNIIPNIQVVFDNNDTQLINLTQFAFNPSQVGVGTRTITYLAIDPISQCQTQFSKTVFINANPELSFSGLEDSYCSQALPVRLVATPSGGTFTINGVVSTVFNPTLFAVGERPEVVYTFTDPNGCGNEIRKTIEITASDTFVPVQEDLRICPPQFTGYVLAAVEASEIPAGASWTFDWQPQGFDTRTITISEASQSGIYVVVVRDEAGCPIALKTFEVEVNCEPQLFLPTAFSPNDDGLNDVFAILGQDLASLDFKIYNRWGELVFQSFRVSEFWDGRFRGKDAEIGVYIWTATYENVLQPGIKLSKQGRVTLIR